MLAPTFLALALSTISLGSEVPVGTPALSNAAFNQNLGDVASNGRDYLAIWSDTRGTTPVSDVPSLYAGRVDASGHPVDPIGHKIADRSIGRLTWTGTSYLLVYTDGAGFYGRTLDDDGNPVGNVTHMDLGAPPRAIASNGRNVLVVQTTGQVWLMALDGSVIWKQLMPYAIDLSAIFQTTSGDYAFVSLSADCPPDVVNPCPTVVRLNTIDATTGALQQMTLANLGQGARAGAASSSDGRLLVAWLDGTPGASVARYEIVDEAGHVVVAPSSIVAEPAPYLNFVSAGWDGHEYLVALSALDLRTYRIAGDGTLVDAQPMVLAGRYATAPLFARTAAGAMLAWDVWSGTDYDVQVRAASSFEQLSASQTNVLAMSAPEQRSPRLANGVAPLVAWSEGGRSFILASAPVGGTSPSVLDGGLSFLQTAGVARGSSSYLVAWLAGDAVETKRVAFDGTPIDQETIVVAHDPEAFYTSDNPSGPAVAFDGTNFLIIWTTFQGDIHGVRVSSGGRTVDAQPIAISSLGFHAGNAITPRVVWSGSRYVVGWLDQLYSLSLISPPPPMPARLSFVRVTAAGQVLDATPLVIWQQGGAQSLALAVNGQELLALWIGGTDLGRQSVCVWGVRLRTDGSQLDSVRELVCAAVNRGQPAPFADIDLAWSGTDFVGVWSDPVAENVQAYRLDAVMTALDAAPFLVNPTGSRASQPSIAASGVGTTIVYLRVANEPQFGGVPRIFARTLPRLGALPRVRVAPF